MSHNQQQQQQPSRRPPQQHDIEFRISDTPYGRNARAISNQPAFVPAIVAAAAKSTNSSSSSSATAAAHNQTGAAAGENDAEILVEQDGSIVTLAELHRRRLDHARRAAPAAVCIEVEELRVRAMDELREMYGELLRREGGFTVVPNESFNRWVFESMVVETTTTTTTTTTTPRDPLIPTAFRVSPSLVREMVDDQAKQLPVGGSNNSSVSLASLPPAVFHTLCTGIAVKVAEVAREKVAALTTLLNRALLQHQQQSTATSPVRGKLEVDNSKGCAIVSLTSSSSSSSSGAQHEFLAPYAEKFRIMFESICGHSSTNKSGNAHANDDDDGDAHRGGKHQDAEEEHMADRLYCMLQRYRALARGSAVRDKPREGSGHHAAVPAAVLDKLRELVGCKMECFASPFNSHYFPYFCSAFADTDSFFGSVGSFFEFRPVQGSFQVNPPYVEEVMDEMRRHICSLLRRRRGNEEQHQEHEEERPLSFTIVVPDWITDPASDGTRIRASPPPSAAIRSMWEGTDGLTRARVHIKDQTFLDGFQHVYRRAAFRTPNPTLVIVMQNEAGARRWPVGDAAKFAAPLKEAWAQAAKEAPETVVSRFAAPGSSAASSSVYVAARVAADAKQKSSGVIRPRE